MKERVFSGARPTGRQHIGNLIGALQNWVKLQDDYECFYCIVDLHALTSLEDTGKLKENIYEMLLDWLAIGLNPNKSTIFIQSHVPQVTELYTLFGMLTPLGWLLRVPTFKEKARLQPHNINYGLVGYPVLMAADITLYKASKVPVGEDQLPHLELTREIVRRFNDHFGETFPEPQAILTSYPLVIGLDGKEKMSKQLGNHIEIAASPEETRSKIMTAVTDPARRYRSDPGHPDICNVFRLHGFFNSTKTSEIAELCRSAQIGCVDCKSLLAEEINQNLAPIRQRRKDLSAKPDYVKEVLVDGASRASHVARSVIKEVKEKIGLILAGE